MSADNVKRDVTAGQLCQMLGSRIEGVLRGITGAVEGAEPAFAFILWVDGHAEVHWTTNRGVEEFAQRVMGVLTELANQPAAEARPAIVVPS